MSKPARFSRKSLQALLAPWVVPAGLLLAWQMAAQLGWLSSRILPEPLAIAKAAWRLSVSG